MTFESEGEFRYWLQINGYSKDDINDISYKWDSVTITNGQITDAITQTAVADEITDAITTSET